MANWCLLRKNADELLSKIKNGSISYAKLRKMDSEARNTFFKESLGVTEKDASKMNVLFEQKLLQKDFFKAMDAWSSRVTGIPSKRLGAIRKNISTRKAQTLDRVFDPQEGKMFMQELAEQKIGVGITREEASVIMNLSKKMEDTSEMFTPQGIKSKLVESKGLELTKSEEDAVDGLLSRISEHEASGDMKKFLSSNAWRDLRRTMTDGIPDDARERVLKAIDDTVNARKSDSYGVARKALEKTIGEIKLASEESVKDIFKRGDYAEATWNIIRLTSATAKAMKGSFDASAIGRQGWGVLKAGNYKEWFSLVKTNAQMFKQAIGMSPSFRKEQKILNEYLKKSGAKFDTTLLDGVQIQLYNRPLGRTGIYDRMKIAIGGREEQFAESVGSKIPGIGKGFDISEEAFTGGLWIARAGLADKFYTQTLRHYSAKGINILAEANSKILDDELLSIGRRINSMTGRGTEGAIGKLGEKGGVAFWSPKFMQSQIDTVTAHWGGSRMLTPFQKKQVMKDWIFNVGTTATMLGAAKYVFGQKVEDNPTSSKFGTINGIDVTGGSGGYIAFISKLGTMVSNKTGISDVILGKDIGIKSSRTGISKAPSGITSVVSILADFASGKTSPLTKTMLDIANGYNFDKESMKIDINHPGRTAWIFSKGLFVPIPIENIVDAGMKGVSTDDKKQKFYDALNAGFIADLFGFSNKNIIYTSNWESSTGQEVSAFREKLGSDKFLKANNEFSAGMNEGIQKMNNSERYKNLSNKKKQEVFDNLQKTEKQKIYDKYDFVPKRDVDKTLSNEEKNDKLSDSEISDILK